MSINSQPPIAFAECPRDGWQGIRRLIPTSLKTAYIQLLTKVGYDIIDAGSFVSPKAVPQVSDTREMLQGLNLENSHSKLLVIVANEKGAEQACVEEKVSYLGYPFSISGTFQQKNANSTIQQSLIRLKAIQELGNKSGKELMIYLSMGFGNPYGDPWSEEMVVDWVETLSELGIRFFSIADTVGIASPVSVGNIFSRLSADHPHLSVGAHFHARPGEWLEKVSAAYDNGCRRFDGTISGFGGCPFAQDALVGNLAMENLISFAEMKGLKTKLDKSAFKEAQQYFNEHISPFQNS